MGWTSSIDWRSAEDVARDRIYHNQKVAYNGTIFNTLAHTLTKEKGTNVLWSVIEVSYTKDTDNHKAGDKIRFIGCDLIEGSRSAGWGYKDMEESMHPYYYSCPVEYLDMAPAKCELWRANVREFHDAKRTRRRFERVTEEHLVAMNSQGELF